MYFTCGCCLSLDDGVLAFLRHQTRCEIKYFHDFLSDSIDLSIRWIRNRQFSSSLSMLNYGDKIVQVTCSQQNPREKQTFSWLMWSIQCFCQQSISQILNICWMTFFQKQLWKNKNASSDKSYESCLRIVNWW